jgi:hypothetical protein
MSKSGFLGLKILVLSRANAINLFELTMRLVADNPRIKYIFNCQTVSANIVTL